MINILLTVQELVRLQCEQTMLECKQCCIKQALRGISAFPAFCRNVKIRTILKPLFKWFQYITPKKWLLPFSVMLLLSIGAAANAEYHKETQEERTMRVGLCQQRCFLSEKHCLYGVAEDSHSSSEEKQQKTTECATIHEKCHKGCDVDLVLGGQ